MLRTALAALVLAAAASSALADVKGNPSLIRLAPLFTDHMVLQRGLACPIWGTATPGAKVSVSLDDAKSVATATADEKGAFRLKLPKLGEGSPHVIKIDAGAESVTLSDVVAGEVWICSGQSNMQWTVWDTNDRENEVKNANFPNIRFFSVPHKTSDSPLDTFDAAGGPPLKWEVCTPQTVGGFSAVGYFFGRMIHKELNVPVGLIHTSWGGTIAEAWTPAKEIEQLNVLPGVAGLSQQLKQTHDPAFQEQQRKNLADWCARAVANLEKIDPANVAWSTADFDDSGWKTLPSPGDWRAQGVPNGLGWLRKTIDVPADLAGKDMTLSLGIVDDFDVTYVNGEKVGAVEPSVDWNFFTPRNYKVPGKLIKAGKNVIAVRVLDTGGAGGINGPGEQMKISASDDAGKSIPLAGDWKVISERSIDPQTDPRPSNLADPNNPNFPSRLYNAMIHPLHDYAIKGAIWYQGESNADRAGEYEKVLSTMIGAWREQIGVGEFPFYQVGLANFMAPTDDPNKPSNWAHLREAQRQIGRNVKNAGMTVTIDIGEEKDIHPKNKQDVGKRLALMALKNTYGKDVVSRGPTLKAVTFDGAKAIVSFDNIGSGLMAKEGKLESFAIAGDDGKFAWADASIEGDTVVLSSKDVPNPTQVHYAFADNPKASLFNKEGLPAEPFEAGKK